MNQDQVAETPAGFRVRLAARVVDSVIYLAILPVMGIITAIAVPQIAKQSSADTARLVLVLIVFVGLAVFPCLYYTLMTASKGQTLGKMLFNLKVVQTDGAPLSFSRSFLRWLSYLLSAIPLGLGYLFSAFQKDKRALHDLACGTKVVQVGPTNIVGLVLVFVMVPFVGATFGGILAAIAIPRFAQMLEKSREASTKANLGSIKLAVTHYYADHQGQYPSNLETDLVPAYLEAIPSVKITGAFVANGQSPAGNKVLLAEPNQVPTGSGSGWLYDRSLGNVYVDSTVKDSKGIPYSFYGFE